MAAVRRSQTLQSAFVLVLLCVAIAPAPAVAQAEAAVEAEAPSEGAAEPPPQPEVDPLVAEADALWSEWQARDRQIDALRRQLRGATGEDLLVLEEKIWQKQLEAVALTRDITDNVIAQEARELDASELRARITKIFTNGLRGYIRHFEWREERIGALRDERAQAEGRERIAVEKRLTAEQDHLQIALSEFALSGRAVEQLGHDASEWRAELESRLGERAEDLAGRLEIDWRQRDALRDQLERDPDKADLQDALEAANESFERRKRLLSATVSLMEPLELPAAAYKETLIRTTGELSTGIFDREVAAGLARDALRAISARVNERGPVWAMQVLLLVSILLIFWVTSVVTRRLVARLVRTSRVDISNLLRKTLVDWSSRTVMFVGVLVALSQVGIEIGPLLAGLGIAGFIVGFALQDSLANFAAGAMILIYRPYDVDDVIESGTVRGMVSHMSLVSTTILTFDNQTLIVPNNKIWGDVIRNVTAQAVRRVDLRFRIGYEQDLERIEALLLDVVKAHEKVVDDPAPAIRVDALGEYAVELIVRPWTAREDYWGVYWDLTRDVKLAFDREGIEVPRPQREVVVRPGWGEAPSD